MFIYKKNSNITIQYVAPNSHHAMRINIIRKNIPFIVGYAYTSGDASSKVIYTPKLAGALHFLNIKRDIQLKVININN